MDDVSRGKKKFLDKIGRGQRRRAREGEINAKAKKRRIFAQQRREEGGLQREWG